VAQRSAGVIRITVSDDGPGIPDEEKPKETERFYRGDASRGTPGVGLGSSTRFPDSRMDRCRRVRDHDREEPAVGSALSRNRAKGVRPNFGPRKSVAMDEPIVREQS
jgi:DNA topoisomerase VI subunit B